MMFWLFWGCAGGPVVTAEEVAPSTEGMVLFESSTFTMGFPDTDPGPYGNHWKETAQPAHEVSLSAYYLDAFEVTVADWADFLSDLGGTEAAVHYHPLQPLVWRSGGMVPQSGEEERPA